MRNTKGQNTVEYILLVTAVILTCIYFFNSKSGRSFSGSINSSLNSIVNQVNNLNSQIQLQ